MGGQSTLSGAWVMNTAVISASTTGRRSCQRKIYRPITCMRVCRTAWHYKTTNHIAVRDYLRTHPSEAAVYSKLKKGLAERFPNERERYVESKTDFILSLLEQCGFFTRMAEPIRWANHS